MVLDVISEVPVISSKASGFNYEPFSYTVRSFCLSAVTIVEVIVESLKGFYSEPFSYAVRSLWL